MDEEFLKRHFSLKPLPKEGGYFAETYRSPKKLGESSLSDLYQGERSIATAIFYLLTPSTYSALHMLPGDEIYHFYLGDPVEMLQLYPDGTGRVLILGPKIDEGMHLQVCVPGRAWQGSRLVHGGRFALLGTTMAPGFDFEDFRAGDREALLKAYPQYSSNIAKLVSLSEG